MNATGYAADAIRGHDHPDSCAARRQRIAETGLDKAIRRTDWTMLCYRLGQMTKSERDIVDVIHAITAGINKNVLKSTDMLDIVERLDMLADEIEFRDAS